MLHVRFVKIPAKGSTHVGVVIIDILMKVRILTLVKVTICIIVKGAKVDH